MCQGLNDDGQSLVPMTSNFKVYGISTGYKHTCSISMNHDVSCWGRSLYGETMASPSSLKQAK